MKRIILRDCEASAFYAGRLTQLMRPVKTTRATGTICGPAAELGYAIQQWGGGKWNIASHTECIPCPLGGVGSRLWVAEAFKFWCHSFESVGVEYVAGGDDKIVDFEDGWDMPSLEVQTRNGLDGSRLKRSPSTMPRWASRSIIELTAVRVKRVQEVTEDEAKRCGHECMLNTDGTSGWHADRAPFGSDYSWLKAAKHCWIADHGQASWDRNDWVWVRDVRGVER